MIQFNLIFYHARFNTERILRVSSINVNLKISTRKKNNYLKYFHPLQKENLFYLNRKLLLILIFFFEDSYTEYFNLDTKASTRKTTKFDLKYIYLFFF